MRYPLMLASVVALIACGTGHGDTADDLTELKPNLNGTWVLRSNIPGAHESMTLTDAGNNLSGSGEYRIEAGRSGTSRVSGTFDSLISITVTRDYGQIENFRGKLEGPNRMVGKTTFEGLTGELDTVFVRAD